MKLKHILIFIFSFLILSSIVFVFSSGLINFSSINFNLFSGSEDSFVENNTFIEDEKEIKYDFEIGENIEDDNLDVVIDDEEIEFNDEKDGITQIINFSSKTSLEKITLADRHRRLNEHENLLDVFGPDINNRNLPIFLDDKDSKILEYKMALSDNFLLKIYSDEDYFNGTSFHGFMLDRNDLIMNYTIDFSDGISWDDILNENILIFGKNYYVDGVNFESKRISLLENPHFFVLKKGDFVIIDINGSQTNVSLSFMGANEVILYLNGIKTNKLNVGHTYGFDGFQLSIGSLISSHYQGVSLAVSASKIEISNGFLRHNLKDIYEIESKIYSDSEDTIDKIVFSWKIDENYFFTGDKKIVLPYFETLSLSMSDKIVESFRDDYWEVYLEAITYSNNWI